MVLSFIFRIRTWDVTSKWRRSCARAETPTVAGVTPWWPRACESSAVEGLQQLPYKNLIREFPMIYFCFFTFSSLYLQRSYLERIERSEESFADFRRMVAIWMGSDTCRQLIDGFWCMKAVKLGSRSRGRCLSLTTLLLQGCVLGFGMLCWRVWDGYF